jgi:hypothetical protein
MMANVSESMPLHDQLAIAVAKVLYHEPEGLDDLPFGFGVRVQRKVVKPYGLCDQCYAHDDNYNSTEHCEHFLQEPSDYDSRRYHEATNATMVSRYSKL